MKNSKIPLGLSLGFLLASLGLIGPAHATDAAAQAAGRPPAHDACGEKAPPDCARAGACGVDGFNAPAWDGVNKKSSGCDASEAEKNSYDEAAAKFSRLDERSSSFTNLIRRYQRLCATQ
jgi:hypothetical protein